MINLKNILKGKVVILCIGNAERGDDGAGPRLASMIKGKAPYEVIDAGIAPENWTGVITKLNPDTVIMVDAVDFEGKPGEMKIFKGEDIRSGKISTHDVSLKLLTEYFKESIKADIYVLGIKPQSNRLGEGLSPCIKASLDSLIGMLLS